MRHLCGSLVSAPQELQEEVLLEAPAEACTAGPMFGGADFLEGPLMGGLLKRGLVDFLCFFDTLQKAAKSLAKKNILGYGSRGKPKGNPTPFLLGAP